MELLARQSSSYVVLVASIAALGGFLFGFDSSVIANAKDQMSAQFALSDFQWAQIVSVSLLGSMVGIPLSGIVSDRVSRKTLLQLVAVGFILGSLLSALANDLPVLYAGRFLIGVCIGIASYVSPLFIAEIAPRKTRGSLILLNGIAITFGQAVSFLIGYWLHDVSLSSWRLLLFTGTIPAAFLLVGMCLVPHSPRFLMMRYGSEKAREVLNKIRGNQREVQTELTEIEQIASHGYGSIQSLLKPPFCYVLLLGLSLGIFQQFSGINAIMYYGPVIFEAAGFHPIKSAILATSWLGFLNFIFTIVTLLFADKVGRRFCMLSGSVVAAFSMFAISLAVNEKWLIVVLLSTFIIGYCVSVGSLFWVVIAEIYPLKIRGLAMSIATVLQWAANFVVSISFLSLFHAFGELKLFWLFGFICLLAAITTYYFLPETARASLESIEENLLAGKKLRELGQVITSVKLGDLAVKTSNETVL
ncbi:MAG: sugar:proton symporter [Gammaproteobacteria bacterium RIFCSPHIGHO2_12_FULL_43_28]|nr:MAG: sugar:proton symporter [Gammaproteobacteria bacterium RIFCSPHIGHO2_12_FULL_43_28]